MTPTVTTTARVDPRTFFLTFSIESGQEKGARDLLTDLVSPRRKVPLDGILLARSGTRFYGVATTTRAVVNAVRYFRLTLSDLSRDVECCPLTRTHELRMRWVRQDPMAARMREAAQELEEELEEEEGALMITWPGVAASSSAGLSCSAVGCLRSSGRCMPRVGRTPSTS